MLTIKLIHGSNAYAAAHYFASGDDYYSQEHGGQWVGRGAEWLALSGDIDPHQFARLLRGQLPNGAHIPETYSVKDSKRMGLDLTFSAPKSVSLQALVAGDAAVRAAHDRAVAAALAQIEPLVAVQQKIQGKSTRQTTGNFVAGVFRHEMSRAKDPQLHTHVVVLNITQRADGQWRALANEALFLVQHQMDALYKAELAHGVQQLGYAIRPGDEPGSFELAHISRAQIEAFSARSQVIEAALADRGKTRLTATPLEKQIIALATRPKKDERERELIHRYWQEKSRELGMDYQAWRTASPAEGTTYTPGLSVGTEGGGVGDTTGATERTSASEQVLPITPARAIVQYAVRHLSEREQVFTRTQLMTVALRRAMGLCAPSRITEEIERLTQHGTLIPAPTMYRLAGERESASLSAASWQQWLMQEKNWPKDYAKLYVSHAIQTGTLMAEGHRYTTQQALKREKAILSIERAGRDQLTPILPRPLVQQALQDSSLTSGQRSAVETLLCSPHRFAGIQGDAGTGKTHAIQTAVSLLARYFPPPDRPDSPHHHSPPHQHWHTLAVAPYGNQVKALKEHGLDAHTLASFLNTKYKPIHSKTLVILDEAGVVPARQMAALLKIVERSGARLVMVGDTKQTEAIEAGQPFYQLQQAGMQTALIQEIQRQRDPQLKQAVMHAVAGQTHESLSQLHHVEALPYHSDRRAAIVTDYMALPEAQRQQTLIVTGTHEARQELNGRVREALGLLGTGKTFDTLTRLDTTQAQRGYAPSYQPGSVIQPERDYKKLGLARGELYTVKEALPGNLLRLETPDKTLLDINPYRVKKLSVYERHRSELAVGDTIRINRNDPQLDLTNGDRFRVCAVTSAGVTLQSLHPTPNQPLRQVDLLATRPLHLEHAYSSTIHSTQGLTCERVLIELNTRSRTTSLNLYYVAISRAKLEARVYTDSIRRLPEAIARRFDKTTALEVQQARQMQQRGVSEGKTGLEKASTGRELVREK